MSLAVRTFVISKSGAMTTLAAPPGGSELAGFENWRTEVWGSAAVRALGAAIFPQLAVQDLHVMPGRQPGETREAFRATLTQRLDNIEAAIRRAKKVCGGVSIE